jgi:alanyl-tRNA synthetase
MRTVKELKKDIKKLASSDPDKYYATKTLRDAGFKRSKCEKCGVYFWSTDSNRKICGDSMCGAGFDFFKSNPSNVKLSFIDVWVKFAKMFKTLGYTPIDRYPVVARWNPTMEYVNASIAAFQPYVISGEVEPPANPLVIPQFSVRFGDIDNIGITASHQTGFVMIGQHMFVTPDKWDQEKVFSDIKQWLNDGLGLPDKEITFHEDAWAGGGNAGVCMEYFCRGVELGNQVYMMYEHTPDDKLVDLQLKVLDMGMGHERNAWFTQGTPTQHQAVYPDVVEKLQKRTGVEFDNDLMHKFYPISGKLNVDEVDDINEAWKEVAGILKVEVKDLKEKIMKASGIFSVADHTRTLLFILNDGGLPSNVGGGYNLRVLIRRALGFIDKFNWDLTLAEVCTWHAEFLKPIFPELMGNLDNIKKILTVERQKYEATKVKTRQIVKKIIEKDITEKTLLELYDSNGISPDLIIKEALKLGKKIEMPDNFYGKISELHEQKAQVHATKKDFSLDLNGLPETIANYYDDYKINEFKAKVLKVIDNKVILDKTLFYPTSGGQLNDIGVINGIEVIDVFKQGAIIVHVLKDKLDLTIGEEVNGKIDLERRTQLSQHHTAAHIVNRAAKNVLGMHINQAGAKKTLKKAHLDITHYQAVSESELKEIEKEANAIIKKNVKINKKFYPRREAEDKFGMEIYQGGAVPGKMVRIIEIPEIDIEACGGTHLNNTCETGIIKMEKSTKIQDGIVRLTFTAGAAAEKSVCSFDDVLDEVSKLLEVENNQIPARVKEIFALWKKTKKAKKKKKVLSNEELKLSSNEVFDGDVLIEIGKILRTQPAHVIKTLNRFLKDIEEYKKSIL